MFPNNTVIISLNTWIISHTHFFHENIGSSRASRPENVLTNKRTLLTLKSPVDCRPPQELGKTEMRNLPLTGGEGEAGSAFERAFCDDQGFRLMIIAKGER